jgi:actin
MNGEISTVVIDMGSWQRQAGFGGEEVPRSEVQSVIGRFEYPLAFSGGFSQDTDIGSNAFTKSNMVVVRHPIERGVVTNWDDAEKLWHHIFYNQLGVDLSEHAILIGESPLNRKSNGAR